MANVTMTFDDDARAGDAPEFVDRCNRIARSLHERLGPTSLRFRRRYLDNQLEMDLLSASVAWRNEVFAFLHAPVDEVSAKIGIVELSDPEGKVYRSHAYNEEHAKSELRVLLRMHFNVILKRHELRVLNARAALDFLEPGHPPGLVHRKNGN